MEKIEKLTRQAEDLYAVRKQITEREEEVKNELQELKDKRDTLQNNLIKELDDIGLKSIKVATGDSFALASRKGYRITNEIAATKWAIDNRAVKIDQTILARKIKESGDTPKWAEPIENKYISVRKAK